jgi:hypothetical protein
MEVRLVMDLVPAVMLRIFPEQAEDIVEAELRCGLALALDSHLRQGSFLFLQVEDPLLDAIADGDFVDDDIDRLVEPVDAVDGLFFDELCNELASWAGQKREPSSERGGIPDSRMVRG